MSFLSKLGSTLGKIGGSGWLGPIAGLAGGLISAADRDWETKYASKIK